MSVSFLGAQAVEGGGVASSRPRIITANASANTKGVYGTAHFTSTASPAAWVLVDIVRGGTAADYLVDVAVGAAAAEQVVIANLPHSSNVTSSPPASSVLLPLFIPAGSRVACRCQASTGSSFVDVQITLFAPMFGSERGLSQSEACGAVTATSLGTSVDPGASTHTKGVWSQLTAATTFAYKWVCVSATHTNAVTGQGFVLDIGIGASTAEVVVVPDLCLQTSATADCFPASGMCFPLSIPAGTRIAARAMAATNTSPDRLLEIVLHGVG